MKVVRVFLSVLLSILYIILAFFILSMLPFIPWHDAEGNYMLLFFVLWLPVCVISLILVVLSFISKRIYRARLISLCFNAVFIPLVFALGFAGLNWLNYVLGVMVLISMAVYIVMFIKSIKDGTV